MCCFRLIKVCRKRRDIKFTAYAKSVIFFLSVLTLPSMSLVSERDHVLRLLLLLLFLLFVRLPFSSFLIRTLNHVCELDGAHTTTCSKRSNTSLRPNTNCSSNSHSTLVSTMLLSNICNSSVSISRTSKSILR